MYFILCWTAADVTQSNNRFKELLNCKNASLTILYYAVFSTLVFAVPHVCTKL